MYDLIVVGAGHAGCEAAAAAARLGCRVAAFTVDLANVGRLSCNPAIGGLAKGHLVRELDALGGLMARVTDAATVQFRYLNTRKGLAVRASRAQVDIHVYPQQMRAQLDALPTLDLLEGEVVDLLLEGGRVAGVRLATGATLRAPKVVLTTGTFLGGMLHRGPHRTPGGREGERPTTALAGGLRSAGLRLFRLKTGTVPRLDGRTIDWSALDKQTEVDRGGRFSLVEPATRLPGLDCYVGYTSEAAHAIIRENLSDSPLHTGAITGRGPRYCPSFEDKIVRFPDRERHRLFFEPEGWSTHKVYVNGLSTSLPLPVQEAVVRTLPGCADAVILQPGYAVEYDVADPRDLGRDLQHRGVPGLYLAGQINGTSGYEEAAVQGFVAGVSAALDRPFVLGRDQAYLGVLVDDLVHKGVGGEPYRMFTSRAEHRLLLREDNAADRLLRVGRGLGLVEPALWSAYEASRVRRERALAALETTAVTPSERVRVAFGARAWPLPKKPTTAAAVLRRPEVAYGPLRDVVPELPELSVSEADAVTAALVYAPYVAQAEQRAARAAQSDAVRLPTDVDWQTVTALSNEVRERLAAARPETLGALGRLPGVTPAAVQVVSAWLQRRTAAPGAPQRR